MNEPKRNDCELTVIAALEDEVLDDSRSKCKQEHIEDDGFPPVACNDSSSASSFTTPIDSFQLLTFQSVEFVIVNQVQQGMML